jgi:hypothetical protein
MIRCATSARAKNRPEFKGYVLSHLVWTHVLLYATNNPKKIIYVSTDQQHMECNIGGLRGSPIPTVIQINMVVFNLQNSKKLSTRRPRHMFNLTFLLRYLSSIESIAKFLWIVGCPQAFKQVESRLGLWKVHMKFKATTASIVSWFPNPSSKVI